MSHDRLKELRANIFKQPLCKEREHLLYPDSIWHTYSHPGFSLLRTTWQRGGGKQYLKASILNVSTVAKLKWNNNNKWNRKNQSRTLKSTALETKQVQWFIEQRCEMAPWSRSAAYMCEEHLKVPKSAGLVFPNCAILTSMYLKGSFRLLCVRGCHSHAPFNGWRWTNPWNGTPFRGRWGPKVSPLFFSICWVVEIKVLVLPANRRVLEAL